MHLFLVCMPRASLFSHVPNTQWVREICLWTSWWSKFVKKHCGLAAVTPWCLGHQARRAPLRSEHWVRTWCCHQPPAKKQNGRTRVPPWKTGVQKIHLEDEPLARHVSAAEGNSSQINLLLEKSSDFAETQTGGNTWTTGLYPTKWRMDIFLVNCEFRWRSRMGDFHCQVGVSESRWS